MYKREQFHRKGVNASVAYNNTGQKSVLVRELQVLKTQ